MNLQAQNNITNNQTPNIQTGNCLQCQVQFPKIVLNFMAQFNSYVCKSCYDLQASLIMQYKKNKPKLFVQYDEIQQGLYLGNEDAATDLGTFVKTGINAICVCGSYLLSPFQDKFQYKKYFIADCPTQNIINSLQQNFEWIMRMRKQNKIILVHCAAGVSRSASFVIAYLMKSRNLTYLQAYEYVKSKRSVIHPNSGFVKQLQQYQIHLKQTNNTLVGQIGKNQ